MLCCFFKEASAEHQSFEEYWNSDYMKKYRLMFLEGNLPEVGCSKCFRTDFSRAKSIEVNTTYSEAEIRANTAADGSTTLLPQTTDIRVDLCNLKCVTCHYYSSSKWATHDNMERKLVGVFGKPVPDEILRAVRTAEWAGGEPFMSPVHFDALERLVQMGRASEVSLNYTTNGTFPGHTFEKSMNLLKEFKEVMLNISIDALGHVGEFIRDGWKSEDLEVFDKIRERLPNVKLLMGITVTSVGLFHLRETLEYAIKHDIHPMVHQVSTFPDNSFLDMNLVKPADFERLISDVRTLEAQVSGLKQSLDVLCRNYRHRVWSEVDRASWLRRGLGSQRPESVKEIIKKLK